MMRYLLLNDLARVHCAHVQHEAEKARPRAGTDGAGTLLSILRKLLLTLS